MKAVRLHEYKRPPSVDEVPQSTARRPLPDAAGLQRMHDHRIAHVQVAHVRPTASTQPAVS